MIANSRFFSILHIYIYFPFRWLTGHTHKLAHRNWGPSSMGRAIDLIYHACKEIIQDPSLIHEELFMLHIFNDLLEELPEFEAHLEYEFKNKKSEFVEALQTKAVPLKEIIKELFSPTNLDNQDRTEMIETITTIGIQALIDELLDEKKATYKYLSILGSKFSHELMSIVPMMWREQC